MAFIETDRLILRTWMPSDAARLHEMLCDPDVTRHLIPRERTLQSTREWIERQSEAEEAYGFSVWPVIRKEDGRLIGRVGLHRTSAGLVEIAWVFERSAWGCGYATEAAHAVLELAHGPLGIPHVYAHVAFQNVRSIATVYRLGMRFDRVVRAYKRDVLRYVG